jgi:UDP-glucose 4-epimerase
MNIVLTGGAGFIASHIAEAYLQKGHNVIIIDNLSTGQRENIPSEATFIECDVTDQKAVESIFHNYSVDVINHHAAQINVRASTDDPTFDARVNILGSLNLYEVALKHNVKKIIFSSTGGAIYGEINGEAPTESYYERPLSPYGISKLSNEKYLDYYHKVHGIQYVVLRYSNVYGPRQNAKGEAGVVAIFSKMMLNKEQPTIFGDGSQTRDYLYVKDAVQANVLALEENVQGVFNCATNTTTSVNQVFQEIRQQTGSDCEQLHAPRKLGEVQNSVCSYEKIHRELGWSPQYDVARGLQETVDWFKNNLDRI